MIDKKKILAIIPARGGSKGIVKKNILPVAGKPLIAWTIEEAKRSKYIDKLILSSDDSEIIRVAQKCGCEVPFVRPAELAQDNSPSVEVVLQAIRMLPGYDYVVLLQPTSPLRIVNDIDGCIEYCLKKGADSCVAISESEKNPYWMLKLDSHGCLRSLIPVETQYIRRQDLPKVYVATGAVYCAKVEWIIKEKSLLKEGATLGYLMPQERSLDIDTEIDLQLCSLLLAKGK